jgi:hypothetical protein
MIAVVEAGGGTARHSEHVGGLVGEGGHGEVEEVEVTGGVHVVLHNDGVVEVPHVIHDVEHIQETEVDLEVLS